MSTTPFNDYIECIFKSLDTTDEYLELEDSTALRHGVIAEFYNQKGEYVYFYSEPNRTPKECLEDIHIIAEDIIKSGSGGGEKLKFSKYTYWRLDEMIIQRVVFNDREWLSIIPKINTFWEKVEEYRLLPIEIAIKKYVFVDDDTDAVDAADNGAADKTSTAATAITNKYKFILDDDE